MVKSRYTGRRTDIVAKSRRDSGFCLDAGCHGNGVVIIETGICGGSPSAETAAFRTAKIAHPRYSDFQTSYVLIKRSRRRCLECSHASACKGYVHAVPLRQCPTVTDCLKCTENHVFEVYCIGIPVFIPVKSESGKDFPFHFLIVFDRLTVFDAVLVDIELNCPSLGRNARTAHAVSDETDADRQRFVS